MRTFLPSLFCLGLETKGAKHPPPQKQVQRLCSAGHTSLESFPFQTASQIFLTSMATLLSFHSCQLMLFRKNGLSADGTKPLHWHSDFFSIFTFRWDCFMHSVWSSYLQRFRITSRQAADPLSPNPYSPSIRELLYSSVFSAFLQSSSKKVWRSFTKIWESVKIWDASLTCYFLQYPAVRGDPEAVPRCVLRHCLGLTHASAWFTGLDSNSGF